MNTKLIVIGEQTSPPKKLVPIEFHSFLEKDYDNRSKCGLMLVDMDKSHDSKPNDYIYIELVCRDYFTGIDLMFTYDDPYHRQQGMFIVGRWNDGVVE